MSTNTLTDLTTLKPEAQPEGEAQQLPRSMEIPKNRYNLRIKTCAFELSKNGNKMLVLDTEIYDPVEVKHPMNGHKYGVSGLSTKKYVMMHTTEDLIKLKEFMERLGLVPAINTDNPDTEQFVGKCFSDIIKAKKFEKRQQATAEQLQADPKAQGEPIIDPETGKAEFSYGIETDFGLNSVRKATKVANAGF